ncbi:MAG: Sapep family Mn(2+)-dependent dipeptidase [Dethiosulfatibacter sp.]|nr:Sapep family Mn(2+)-dependent dipeptidase [Dethiosulfatibacter sp.]
MIEKMMDEIKKRRNEIIADSLKLIDIPSLTRDIDENRKCLDYIAKSAQNEGMITSYTKKKDCLVIEIGKGEETIGVLTHVDVVDAGDLDKWQTPPFKGIFDGDFIIGRGAMDDKVPTAIILNIMKVFQSKNLNYKRKFQLIIGTKEEETWTDMESFLNEFKTPDFSFTPDGAFPIHNIEKGYADIEIIFPFDNSFPSGRILTLISGNSPNTIPSRGNFIFQQSSKERTVELISSGESSHSSLPQNGDNALTKLCKMIKGLKLESERFEQILDFILLMNKVYDGSTLGFENDSNQFNGEFIGKTYINPTTLEFRDNKIILNINIRHKLGVTQQSIIDVFNRHSKSYGFSFKISNYLDPLYVEKNHPLFDPMDTAYKEITGSKGGFEMAGGTSYAKALPNTVCWGPVFPGEKDSCHQENEKININSVMTCAEIYGRFLYKACID